MSKNKFIRGFTVYEMVIAVAIISIIASIAFFNQKQFNSDIEINNLAYRMALSFRQAQVYSISVRQYTPAVGPQQFTVPYGVHFNNLVPDKYIVYADANGDGLYTFNDEWKCETGPGEECIELVTIGRGNTIKGWCGFLFGREDDAGCMYSSEGNERFLDVTFQRPDPDAHFGLYKSPYGSPHVDPVCANGPGDVVNCSGWAICLQSPLGKGKKVVIYDTGQISVENVESGTACSS